MTDRCFGAADGCHKSSLGSHRRTIRFAQINLHKSRAPTTELEGLDFDVALVQEPNLNKKRGTVFSASSSNSSYCKRDGKSIRAAIIISREVDYWPLDKLSGADLAAVALKVESPLKQLYAASCYLDIKLKAPSDELHQLVKHCKLQKIPLLVGIDTNAHSTVWGESDSNKRGEALEDWIIENDLYVLNKGSVPTFAPDGSRKTIIDVTIANEWARPFAGDWKVNLDEVVLSDHRLVQFNMQLQIQLTELRIRPYKTVDWSVFTRSLRGQDISHILEDIEVDEMADKLHMNLSAALEHTAPFKRLLHHSNMSTWWNRSLNIKRLTLKNLYRKRFKHERVLQKFRELKREFNNDIRQTKTKSWRDFCTKAESAKDISRLVRILENPPRKVMSVLHDEGKLLDPKSSLVHLLKTHFPDGALDQSIRTNLAEGEEGRDFTGLCQYITPRKVRMAFRSFGDFKSPGPDELPPKALKYLDKGHLEAICFLYKLSIASGKVPVKWREMRVVFIPKAGKSDYALAKSYRPITLSNFILKGLERLIQWYILEYVITKPLFNQHAYTKGRSCETALSSFVNDVEHALCNKRCLLAISLDCSGAFDCIRFDSAEREMRSHGIPSNIVRWYCNLLKGRLVSANVQGQEAQIVPARGSPQGGVLSPLIWNLIMDSLLSQFKGDSIKIIGYADDILLYVVGRVPKVMTELIQPSLNKVIEWGRANGLSFNPSKTQVVMFSRNKRKMMLPTIQMDGKALEYNESFKYLGLDIHRCLSWNKHITSRTDKGKFLLSKCKSVISQKWGLTPQKLEWIYKAVVRPKITYGSLVWSSSITETMNTRLRRMQRLALVTATQPLRSAPTAGLEVLMSWPPLRLHAQEVGLNAYCRLRDTLPHNWDGTGISKNVQGHLQRWQKLLSLKIPREYPVSDRMYRHIWHELQESDDDEAQSDVLKIYTDASKMGPNNGYGWAAISGDYVVQERYYSAINLGVHKVEIMAISEALSWIKELSLTGFTIRVYSDSRSAVSVLNGYVAKDYVTWETMMLLKELNARNTITLSWVKGHSDCTGNELADMLARRGAEEARELAFQSPFHPLTLTDAKIKIRELFLSKWQSDWENQVDCRISKLFMPVVNKAYKMHTMTVRDLQLLSQIVTGHGLFKRHLRHWNTLESYQCSLCGEAEEDSWHLWAYCPAVSSDRLTTLNDIESGVSTGKSIIRLFQSKKIQKLFAENEALIEP